ncbi:MAG: oligopeptide transport system permease protein [Thermomicrobiales bacterium]|nr:oligopeptide transport system permease protein [Thermomicrobiales bacterium]MEA2595169.1 oligopeptide transport system permease protein [Thermomicrobiales bacterium]
MAQTAVTHVPVQSDLAVPQRPAEGLWRDAFRRLRRSHLAFGSGMLLLALLVVAVFAPLVAPKPYDLQDYEALTKGPGSAYWLGTDELGRDILSRLIFGARISLTVGLVVQGVILLIGVPAGLAAGYYGGKIDTAIMRTVDTLYSIPSLLFIIVIMTFLRAQFATAEGGVGGALASLDDRTGGLMGIFIGVGLVNWMPAARLVRAQVVSLKEKEFVEAARGLGASDRRIMAQHLLPNVVATIVVTATLGIPQAIIYEAGISFLGLGARPPMPSWGLMIAEAIPSIRSYPYLLVSPALALSLTVLAFNFLGDGLRDALDPWMRR